MGVTLDLAGWVDVLNRPLFSLLTSDGEVSPFTPLKLIGLLTIAAVVWGAAKIVEKAIHDLAQRRPQSETTAPLVYAWARIFRYAIFILGTLTALGYLGFDMKSLAFLGTTIGVGVGFGLQNIVSNFVCGVIILAEGTLKVRDFVELQSGVRGTVREIGLRFTRVHTNEGLDVLVPNSEFVNFRVTNWTFADRHRRMSVRFPVPHGVDKDLVVKVVSEAARLVPHAIIDAARPVEVRLVTLGESALEFELVLWLGPGRVDRPNRSRSEALWVVEDALRAAGIALPRPQRDLRLSGDGITSSRA